MLKIILPSCRIQARLRWEQREDIRVTVCMAEASIAEHFQSNMENGIAVVSLDEDVAESLSRKMLSLFSSKEYRVELDIALPQACGLYLEAKTVSVDSGEAGGRLHCASGVAEINGDAFEELMIESGTAKIDIASVVRSQLESGMTNIHIGEVVEELTVESGKSDIQVGAGCAANIHISCGMGKITIFVPRDVPVWRSVDMGLGKCRADLNPVGEAQPGEPHIRVKVDAGSGSVTLCHPDTESACVPAE
ncbi:hypothetical protein [Trueperella sp. LYQ143]|uniref:hypothetical protein n=1 Tax=Trueperella sp. LYQ143 TaxID=3391059 RepID=UPI00398328F0